MDKVTVKQMKEFLEDKPDDWIFVVDNLPDYRDVIQVGVLDEGEISLTLED